jgi:hypothetical protein
MGSVHAEETADIHAKEKQAMKRPRPPGSLTARQQKRAEERPLAHMEAMARQRRQILRWIARLDAAKLLRKT